MAEWQSGHAADCKSVHAGSIPTSASKNMDKFNIDCLIIGGGVAGLSCAKYLSEEFKEIYLIEKNNDLGAETSSRNSEVIHAGIYYKKDSLKSKLCIRGKELLYEYLESKDISYTKCGKYIVSTSHEETEKLNEIQKNAALCGLDDLTFMDTSIKKYPFLNSRASLFSPSSGIFDSGSYMASLKLDFEQKGGTTLLGNECLKIEHEDSFFKVFIKDKNNDQEFIIETKYLINAGGLQSIEIANQIDAKKKYEIDLIKGEYYSYQGKERLEHLIYPIPKKESLGIHATIDLGKGIRFGPSAYRVINKNYSIDNSCKEDFYSAISSYWPNIDKNLLYPDYSGIRAKVKGEEDFVIDIKNFKNKLAVNILGYISPGLTSSLALGEFINTSIKES